MFHRKFLLLTGLAVCMAVASLHAQSKKQKNSKEKKDTKTEAPAKPAAPSPTGLQWANRDMTYHGKGYDIRDSAYYPKFRSKQFHRYIEHLEAFPPKPRNMWEVGAGVGLYNVIGDIPSLMLWNKGGGGISLNVRKSLGYIFSMRLQYIYGVARNMDRQLTGSYDAPYTDPNGFGYTPVYLATTQNPTDHIYRSTRMESSMLNVDLMFNAGNISFHRARNKVAFFGYLGIGALAYKTRVNALNDKYAQYDFASVLPGPNATSPTAPEPKKDDRKKIQKAFDKSFETPAANTGTRKIMDDKFLDFAPSVGIGAQYKINKMWNVQVEERFVFPSDQYLDGTRYGAALGNAVSSGRGTDMVNYFSVSLNYNIKYKQCVEPLYWMNPLDNAFNELSYPRHMILPNPVLPDKDEDGVTDQFDKCPKTPAGLKVDANGCPLDSDHDGVPDYLDKQLITPTECQPVNADGIGECPCPDGCKDMVSNGGDKSDPKNPCGNIGACTLLFPENSNKINKGIEIQLTTLAAQMQANPLCKVVITGGGSGSKIKEQRSWEHVNAIIEYMGDKHSISRDRFIFKYGENENENIVQCRPASVNEPGDSNVPPPHPNIK
ncbi:hypothetical protein GCM10023093_19750 [Nemorincola caseinilytica]|uniref:Uncharacterized protein n=1 Tax=Nemorincola caseinilytica TaxID=2054315 RepID=A0ABP8NEW4_9BACT